MPPTIIAKLEVEPHPLCTAERVGLIIEAIEKAGFKVSAKNFSEPFTIAVDMGE